MVIVGIPEEMTLFEHKVVQRFKVNLGEANEILSMRIQKHTNNTLILDQTTYIEKILDEFKLDSDKGVSTPMDPTVKH